MPVFEYRCISCNTKYEVLHKSGLHQEEVNCPNCNSKESKKLFSSFKASVNEGSHEHANSCASGNCDVSYGGGCASGMCGLN